MDQLQLLSPSDVARALTGVHALRSEWLSRHTEFPAYSLGVAIYMDGMGLRFSRYQRLAAQFNPLLRETFGWLYDELRGVLEAYLQAPVRYADADGLALPGFHLFPGHPATVGRQARIHRDLQHLEVPWRAEDDADFKGTLSLTVSLQLPAAGGGMNLWDLHDHDVRRLEPDAVEALARSRPHRYVPYSLGGLALHDGMFLHQIAPMTAFTAGDARFTLQGHGTRCADGWRLYW